MGWWFRTGTVEASHGSRREAQRGLLGIDLGTSQVKALVMTPDGEILGGGGPGTGLFRLVRGSAETDPAEWWRGHRGRGA